MRDFLINAATLVASTAAMSWLMWLVAQFVFFGLPMEFNWTAVRLFFFNAAWIAGLFVFVEWLDAE